MVKPRRGTRGAGAFCSLSIRARNGIARSAAKGRSMMKNSNEGRRSADEDTAPTASGHPGGGLRPQPEGQSAMCGPSGTPHAQTEANYLRLLLESTDEGIYGIDLQANCTLVNRSGAEMVGYKPAELLGTNIHQTIHHSHPDGTPYPVDECPVVRSIRNGRGVRVDTDVFWRRDGSSFPVEYSSYPIVENEVVKGAVVTFTDITQRKRMEAELRRARDELEMRVDERTAELAQANQRLQVEIAERKQVDQQREQLLMQLQEVNQQLVMTGIQIQNQAELERRRAQELETIIESIADGVFLCDANGRIAEVNRAGLRLIGLTEKAQALRPLVDYLALLNLRYPDGRPIAPEELALNRAVHGETINAYEEIARSLQTGRDISLLVSAAPVRDHKGDIVGAVEVIRDITEIRELDRLKDEFISVAAHELKTPVAIMKGYAQALQRTAENLSEPRRKMLDAINRGADRINSIVQDLLDISRIHLGQLELMREPIDLARLVVDVVDRMALIYEKRRIRVVKDVPVVVQGDRARLELVVAGLIDNAIRYSPHGGDIDVAVVRRNNEAVVSVTDRGIGIPREKQKHIFERFYRAHTGTPYDYGGMGVGLYISREVILRHGGRMWFESEEGKGSTFYFSLPLG
ncbi:MAG: PAS domain S-box protein [Chloroflexi bacterium]|nr:PAS domain S-box protein [Chloroflexota bacterium]